MAGLVPIHMTSKVKARPLDGRRPRRRTTQYPTDLLCFGRETAEHWVLRLCEGFAELVIPGRAEGANPESSGKLGILGWIPGSALRAAPE
ncbi:hypothetical protein [Rhodoplanes sp. SY1]|uniref:hypothetical protein n=1 Tax=Rhodoplanes sp. SY1 TaxID=3166646 RepID=UPI0038B50220